MTPSGKASYNISGMVPEDSCNAVLDRVTLVAMKKPKIPKALLDYFKAEGRRGGLIGGRARAEKLSKAERQELARKAVKARWEKAKAK